MVEQLIGDTYWAPVNHVFASGQGKVRMAYVKDEIGNWNLKNFDNSRSKSIFLNMSLSRTRKTRVALCRTCRSSTQS